MPTRAWRRTGSFASASCAPTRSAAPSQIVDWSGHSAAARERYTAHYQDRDDHRHVHGANLGVSASAYRRAGGMPPLPVREDVAFVQRLIALDCRIAWSALPRVVTSARIANRVDGGFSGYLRDLALCGSPTGF